MGNVVDDLDLNDLACDDGFSWSYQQDSSISEVMHQGSRLALFMDRNTTVTNYHYEPGDQPCGARNGFWLTPPADHITIVNFWSSGQGGKIGVISARHAGRVASDVTIRGLTMTGSGENVTIGDVRNLVLEDCNLGTNNIVVNAEAVAQGSVQSCRFGQLIRSSAATAQVEISVVS